MTSAQSNQFDDVLATALRLIKAGSDQSEITPAYIATQVQKAAEIFANISALPVDQPSVVSLLIQRFSHWMGRATTLKDGNGHIDWLAAGRKKDWRYWQRYREFQEAKLSDPALEGLDVTTDEILSLLEDPLRLDAWDRRGLVVGHVQSGKTSNYTGLICKAADAGYKIVIVLAGMHNNLRSQTQIRLEEGFLGYETAADRSVGELIGVGKLGFDLQTNAATTRADNGDFSRAVAKHFHGIAPEARPWLFVVKKQKTVLTSLLRWIQTRVADSTDSIDGRKLVTKLPLLIIDDEADHASVDTGEQLFNADGSPDEEHQPKTINSLIRQLLHAFTRKAFVGYTATPFANIFIHHKGTTDKEGPDLFPKAFIVNLAAPSNYVGPTRVFGTMTKSGREGGLPLIRNIFDHYDLISDSGWMPPKHKKVHVPAFNGRDSIPQSLTEAIYSFVISCAIRDHRGQGAEHCSMLVHVTRYVSVQAHVHRQVDETIRHLRQRITRASDTEELHEQLLKIWEDDFLPTHSKITLLSELNDRPPPLPQWGEVWERLPNVVEDIKVRSLNGTAKDVLDYVNSGSALKVIAIGGDKLARGLTLEGLCTSYFVRTTKMYDTLMQMGRWFGYRPGYLDLCRLYTSPDLITWFGHIADASEELRTEFDFMAEAGLTPFEYGLKVISHEVLTVTAPLKMRNAQAIALTYSGTRPQTIQFHRNATIQAENLEATHTLIEALGAEPIKGPKYLRNGHAENFSGSYLWVDVDAVHILNFLSGYKTHPNATRANSALLFEFVTKMLQIGQLNKWSVALVGQGDGTGDSHLFPGVEVKSFPHRSVDVSSIAGAKDHGNFQIGVLTDPADETIDLEEKVWLEALSRTQAAWRPDPARNPSNLKPIVPNGKGIREARGAHGGTADRGLLSLYPLFPYKGKTKVDEDQIILGWSKPIMAFAIAFPSSSTGICIEYEANQLYYEQEYGPSE